MKFSPGFWSHKDFKDVFIQIVDVVGQGEKGAIIKFIWWNRNTTGEAFRIFGFEWQRLKLPSREFESWEPYTPNNFNDRDRKVYGAK